MTKVHPRIHGRHPEISDADIVTAWENFAVAATRDIAEREVRTGFDSRGREIEMVGVRVKGEWLVFHGMTPPSKKTRREIERARRKAR